MKEFAVTEQRLGTYTIDGSDVEINFNPECGTDLMLRVNKGGVQVFRVRLSDLFTEMSGAQLMHFSPLHPDLQFKIGDNAEGMYRAARAAGLTTSMNGGGRSGST